jgi:hypothetical protein
LFEKSQELFAKDPTVHKVELLAAKVSGAGAKAQKA